MKIAFFLICLIISYGSFQNPCLHSLSADSVYSKDRPDSLLNNKLDSMSGKSELIIRKMKVFKGKRVTNEEFERTPEKIWLLKVYYEKGDQARPVITVVREKKEYFLEYDVIRSFETEEEAINYAKENEITDINID